MKLNQTELNWIEIVFQGQRGRNGDPGRNGLQGVKGDPGELGGLGRVGEKGARVCYPYDSKSFLFNL